MASPRPVGEVTRLLLYKIHRWKNSKISIIHTTKLQLLIEKTKEKNLKKKAQNGEQEHPVGGPASCSADEREAAALPC